MMNGGNNNGPDPLNVQLYMVVNLSVNMIKVDYKQLFDRLLQLRDQRLQPLLDRLQPNQPIDPRISAEIWVKEEIRKAGNLIVNGFAGAFVFENKEGRLQHERTSLMQRFVTLVNFIDNQLRICEVEIKRLERL